MSIENAAELFNKAIAPQTASGRVDRDGKPLPLSKLWLNIGIPVPSVDPTTGERVMDFVSLPVNLAIDTMKKREVPTKAPKTAAAKQYRDRIIASNNLLDVLQKLAEGIASGETMDLSDTPLKLQLQRIEDDQSQEDIASEANPFSDALLAAFGLK